VKNHTESQTQLLAETNVTDGQQRAETESLTKHCRRGKDSNTFTAQAGGNSA